MKLSSMRYKNYTWPHNPKTFVVEYRRQIAAQKVPMGGCILQDLGVDCRILRGEGEFAGPDAYEEFKTLADVFRQTDRAYFVSLSVMEEPKPDYVRYSFAFWEDDSGYEGASPRRTTGRPEAARPLPGSRRLLPEEPTP